MVTHTHGDKHTETNRNIHTHAHTILCCIHILFFFLRLNLINKKVITSDSVYFRHCCSIVFFSCSFAIIQGIYARHNGVLVWYFLEKSWSVGWRPSNLRLLSVECFALRGYLKTGLLL